jgi:hypothetical protein
MLEMANQMLPVWVHIYMLSALQFGGPPSVSNYCYCSKREGVFSDLRLRPSFMSQSEFVDYNKLILRWATVGGLRLPKVLKNMI